MIINLPANIDRDILRAALADVGLTPSGIVFGNGTAEPPTALEFEPDITPEQQAQVVTIYTRISSAQTDKAQAEQLRAGLLTYRESAEAYLALTSPTNAQSVAAIKALIRIAGLLARLVFILMDYRR